MQHYPGATVGGGEVGVHKGSQNNRKCICYELETMESSDNID